MQVKLYGKWTDLIQAKQFGTGLIFSNGTVGYPISGQNYSIEDNHLFLDASTEDAWIIFDISGMDIYTFRYIEFKYYFWDTIDSPDVRRYNSDFLTWTNDVPEHCYLTVGIYNNDFIVSLEQEDAVYSKTLMRNVENSTDRYPYKVELTSIEAEFLPGEG